MVKFGSIGAVRDSCVRLLYRSFQRGPALAGAQLSFLEDHVALP